MSKVVEKNNLKIMARRLVFNSVSQEFNLY